MEMIIQWCRRSGTSFIASCLLILIAHTAIAQEAVPLPKVFEKQMHMSMTNASLDDALAVLLKDAHVNILVDGVPFLQKADVKFDGTLHEGLDLLARTFDYSWTLSKGGSVLMSKRFTSSDDRPQMNLPEMLEMTRNIIRALRLVDYDMDEANASLLVEKMVKSLPQKQQQLLLDGGGLLGSSLSPQQQSVLEQATLTRTFTATLISWQELLPKLEGMPASHLEAHKREGPKPDANSPTHDYLYVIREKDDHLHVYDLPHIIFQTNNDRIVTP